MDQKFEKVWTVIEKPLELSTLVLISSQFFLEYDELSFEEIMLTLNNVFVGHSDGESVFSIKNKNEKRFCNRLLDNLVKIMEKLTMRSSKMITFEDYHSHGSEDATFMMSILLLRIIRAISVHLETANTSNLPIHVGKEYVTLVKPLLQTLTDDFMILNLWLHDFICEAFSSREDFKVLVDNSGTRIRSSDLPHHPVDGPFNDEMKRKFEMVGRNLGNENYYCYICGTGLVLLEDIAIWPDCEHVSYCAQCARSMFIGKEISEHTRMKDSEDGSIPKSRFLVQNKCPECSIPISIWSIGRYFSDVVVHSPDLLPSASEVLQHEYDSLSYIIWYSWNERRTVSYILPLILHATVLQLEMKYTVALNSKLNLEKFKLYCSILSRLSSGLRERGNSYLVQINIRCLQEAVLHFRKNLSWYSGPDTKEECLTLLNQTEKALGDLETKYLTGTAISSA